MELERCEVIPLNSYHLELPPSIMVIIPKECQSNHGLVLSLYSAHAFSYLSTSFHGGVPWSDLEEQQA
jgi:hypothetical protein